MPISITAEHEAATSVRLALAAVHALVDDARPRSRDRPAPRPALSPGRPPPQLVIAAPDADDDPAWREAARISATAVAWVERERLRRLRWAAVAGLVVAVAALATVTAVVRADRTRAALSRARTDDTTARADADRAAADRDRAERLRLRADAARLVAEAHLRALRAVLSVVPFSPAPALVPAAFDRAPGPPRATRPRAAAPPPTGRFTPRCPDDVPLC